MEIDNIDDLGKELGKRVSDAGWSVKGPQYFEWGYVQSPNITFWSADRRVHFFFEGTQGRIYVMVECSQVGPPRRAVVSRIQESDEAFLILSQFLRKRCEFSDLPGDEWISDVPMHDQDIPHPPDGKFEGAQPAPAAPPPTGRPEVKFNLVGSAPAATRATLQKAAQPQATVAKSGVAGVIGVILYSNDPRRLARWYCDMLGAELQEQTGQYAGSIGQSQISIQTSETPVPSGIRPIVLSYAVSDFDVFVGDLASRGAEILGLDESKLGKFAYTRDCDANPIEIWGPPGR